SLWFAALTSVCGPRQTRPHCARGPSRRVRTRGKPLRSAFPAGHADRRAAGEETVACAPSSATARERNRNLLGLPESSGYPIWNYIDNQIGAFFRSGAAPRVERTNRSERGPVHRAPARLGVQVRGRGSLLCRNQLTSITVVALLRRFVVLVTALG